MSVGELEGEIEAKLFELMGTAPTKEAREAAGEAFSKIQLQHIQSAINDLEAGTGRFLSLIDDLSAVIEKIGGTGTSGASLKSLRDRLADAYGEFRSDIGLPKNESEVEIKKPTDDETSEKPSNDPKEVSEAGSSGAISNPTPINKKEYVALSDEYIRFFLGASFKSSASKVKAQKEAQRALANKTRYQTVGSALGDIPWWFIAGIHMLESSFSFDTHLHNGDSLVRRTVRVPAGRPAQNPAAGPGKRYTWEESAIDALKMKGFDNQTDWSLARSLYRWEAYNGFGYRAKGVPTPYLWSFSSIYGAGKFVADHKFSATAVSKQCGAATLLRLLQEAKAVDLKLDFLDEKVETNMGSDFDQQAQKVESNQQPTVDGPVPSSSQFDKFVAKQVAVGKLPALRHFKPGDFLVKGGLNASININNDPPESLWSNVIPLMKVVDEFRERVGHPVVLNSVYRSEAYNAAVGGVSGSQHKKFQAADIRVLGSGNPKAWAQILKTMRSSGFFSGGIGIYNTFVHVDTRGWNANW